MEVPKKRKRDVDYPRITYDAATKVFDRLFKEESLEEMKNVVRKKLGLSSFLSVHLYQLRDGKAVVLEDDEDFDAFYVSIHSNAEARIKVFLGDDLPNTAGLDAGFTGGSIQLLESPTVDDATAVDRSSSKKRRVSFVEPTPQPLRDNVEEPDSSQSLPNSEAAPEFPTTIDVISAGAKQTHEMADNPKKKKRRKVKGNKMNGQTVVSTSEDQSLGGQVQSDIAVVEALSSTSKKTAKTTKSRVHTSENTPHDAVKSQKRPRTSITDNSKVSDEAAPSRMDDDESSPRSSKKSKYKHKNSENLENGVTDPIDDNQADGRTKGPEDSQRHTPSIGQVDPLETVSTRPPQEMKKSRKKKEVAMTDKEPNDALSAPISATSDSTIVVKRAKKQDPKPLTSTPVLETNSKGKTKNSRPSQSLKTPTKHTLNEDVTECEQETKSSASAEGKNITKKSGKNVEPANSAQDQALKSDFTAATMAAVAAILARKSSSSEGSRQIATRSSPLADATVLSPSIAPVTSGSSLDNQPIPPNNTSTSAEQPNTSPKCPVCDKTPSHVRSRCPIIRAGIRSMRQRIAELQDAPLGNDEEREKIIEELHRIIDKRTKRNQTTATENKSTNVKFMADKPVILPTLAADSSPILEPPKTSQTVKSAKAPSHDMKNMPWLRLTKSFSSGDISSYTEQDLEALIRGPNVRLADLPSSDSGQDEEVLEEEPEGVEFEPSQSQGRIRYPSSSEEEEEEEEEEASPFVPSIIPLPIRSVSELSSEDDSSRSEDFQGDTSFHEVNNLGSSVEVDKTGDAAVNDAYALDFAHLNGMEPSGNGPKTAGDISNALDENQVPDESNPKTAPDAARPPGTIPTPQPTPTPQSDPIEASEQPDASSPPSPIVSIEDFLPSQSPRKAGVAGRTRSHYNWASKTADSTSKPHSAVSGTDVNGINGNIDNTRSTRKTRSLTRITDLPVPVNPTLRIIKPVRVQTPRQATRAEEEKEEQAKEQGPTDASQAKQKNAQSSSSKASSNTTKTPAKIPKTPAKTPAKVPGPSNEENLETQSVTMVQDVQEAIQSAPSNAEQSLASWAVLEGNSPGESEATGMVDELRYSPDMPDSTPARRPASPIVNGVSEKSGPLFLHSESQQSFPYSQYPNFHQEPPGSEDEEDEVQASVIKRQTTTTNSSKFRSLTEIASQPTLFTPPMRLTQTNGAKKEVTDLYGRTSKGKEDSEDSDTESGSDAEAKAPVSHIPLSRRAGTLLSKRG